MYDVIKDGRRILVVQAKATESIKCRPQVFHTMCNTIQENFSLETLFIPHDLVNNEEPELFLGLIE